MADSATLQLPAANSSADFVSCDEDAQEEETPDTLRCEDQTNRGSARLEMPASLDEQKRKDESVTVVDVPEASGDGPSADVDVNVAADVKRCATDIAETEIAATEIPSGTAQRVPQTTDEVLPRESTCAADVGTPNAHDSPHAQVVKDTTTVDRQTLAADCRTNDDASIKPKPDAGVDGTSTGVKPECSGSSREAKPIQGSDVLHEDTPTPSPNSSGSSCGFKIAAGVAAGYPGIPASPSQDTKALVAAPQRKQGSADEAAGGGRGADQDPKPSPEEEELMNKVPLLFEAMNEASEEINKLEVSSTDAQRRYSQLASNCNKVYEKLRSQYGSDLDYARPYFDAWEALERSQLRVQSVIRDFSEAASRHAQAKSELRTIEERLQYGAHRVTLDRMQQDCLSQATVRVVQTQQERDALEREYAKALNDYQAEQAEAEEQKHLVGEATIRRAMPGFRQMQQHRKAVIQQQKVIAGIEENIQKTKAKYNGALKDLDTINQAIHKLRGNLQKV